ncbi:MAG TPA: glycoside hydrolase family 130 protein [Acidimicrobiales bacterium]|nr:glycoside hydrolase family 130 protein [Acidimicrobiales bacterium]
MLGATFTHEYSVESVAACNPSMVLHPDQCSSPAGTARVIISVRTIGEGHRSSIGFRSGTVDTNGRVAIDDAALYPVIGTVHPAVFERAVFHRDLRAADKESESAAFVLDHLPETFTAGALDERLAALGTQRDTRRDVTATVDRLRSIADRSYRVDFAQDVELSRRVLWPAMAAESHGMEDARFVRFVDSGGDITYYATYTAYDGNAIRQQLVTTQDFVSFDVSSLAGRVATNKGLALFPRRINGRFAALSRFDRETNSIAFSDDLHIWEHATTLQVPQQSWEVIQLGNCGPPIETPDGWLVLTHGVGPMRTYSIGALLLDLHDPSMIIGQLPEPLLTPESDEHDGYVPNVVYSCGGLLHGDTLVIPYGIADTSTGIATVSWTELRTALLTT